MEMTAKELTTYLKYAAELESSIYRQEKMIQQANEDLQFPYPEMKHLAKPRNKADQIEKPVTPVLQDFSKFPGYIWNFSGLLSLAAAIVLPIIYKMSFPFLYIFAVFFFAIGSLLTWFHKQAKALNEQKTLEYNRAVDTFEKQVRTANQEYEKALVVYQTESEAIRKEYDDAYAIAEQKFTIAKEAVSQLDLPFKETKEALQQLYSKDIIFPKYRNMVAVCTMYEYFVTGRCTELTGPNGAYNMYESELRQNLIINHLDTIIDNLENIKQNQYTLYQEMCTTNSLLSEISSDVEDILNGTMEIANASNISAHCAQVTAKNTEAIKYISLIT